MGKPGEEWVGTNGEGEWRKGMKWLHKRGRHFWLAAGGKKGCLERLSIMGKDLPTWALHRNPVLLWVWGLPLV